MKHRLYKNPWKLQFQDVLFMPMIPVLKSKWTQMQQNIQIYIIIRSALVKLKPTFLKKNAKIIYGTKICAIKPQISGKHAPNYGEESWNFLF